MFGHDPLSVQSSTFSSQNSNSFDPLDPSQHLPTYSQTSTHPSTPDGPHPSTSVVSSLVTTNSGSARSPTGLHVTYAPDSFIISSESTSIAPHSTTTEISTASILSQQQQQQQQQQFSQTSFPFQPQQTQYSHQQQQQQSGPGDHITGNYDDIEYLNNADAKRFSRESYLAMFKFFLIPIILMTLLTIGLFIGEYVGESRHLAQISKTTCTITQRNVTQLSFRTACGPSQTYEYGFDVTIDTIASSSSYKVCNHFANVCYTAQSNATIGSPELESDGLVLTDNNNITTDNLLSVQDFSPTSSFFAIQQQEEKNVALHAGFNCQLCVSNSIEQCPFYHSSHENRFAEFIVGTSHTCWFYNTASSSGDEYNSEEGVIQHVYLGSPSSIRDFPHLTHSYFLPLIVTIGLIGFSIYCAIKARICCSSQRLHVEQQQQQPQGLDDIAVDEPFLASNTQSSSEGSYIAPSIQLQPQFNTISHPAPTTAAASNISSKTTSPPTSSMEQYQFTAINMMGNRDQSDTSFFTEENDSDIPIVSRNTLSINSSADVVNPR